MCVVLSPPPVLSPNGSCIGLVCSFPLLPWRLASQPRRREVTASYNSIQLTNTCTHNSKTGLEQTHTHTKHIHSCIQQTARLTPKGRFIIEVLFQKGVFQILVILLAPLQFEMNVLTLFAGQCASIIWKTCITVTLCAIWRHRGSVIAFFFLSPWNNTGIFSLRAV